MMDINTPFLALQTLNLTLLIAWIILAIFALFQLRKEAFREVIEIIWTLIILLIPVFGALAFLIVRSRRSKVN